MKRRITLSIALVLSIAGLSLVSFNSTGAQNQTRYVFDTGFITPGSNQDIRLSVLSGTPTANGTFNFRIRQFSYTPDDCSGGVCKYSIGSQTESDLVTVMPNEAASIDFRRCMSPICGGIRGVIVTDNKDVRGNISIVDRITGATVSSFSWGVTQSGGFGY